MSKKNRERRLSGGDEADGGQGPSGGASWVPTVLAIAALAFAFYLWTDARSAKKASDAQLASIETRVAQLAQQVVSAQRPPQPQGPDPNKVYAIKLDGAPVKGNATAPIVIAEFSDYQ
jgi:protein-disulfide isomerase